MELLPILQHVYGILVYTYIAWAFSDEHFWNLQTVFHKTI